MDVGLRAVQQFPLSVVRRLDVLEVLEQFDLTAAIASHRIVLR